MIPLPKADTDAIAKEMKRCGITELPSPAQIKTEPNEVFNKVLRMFLAFLAMLSCVAIIAKIIRKQSDESEKLEMKKARLRHRAVPTQLGRHD